MLEINFHCLAVVEMTGLSYSNTLQGAALLCLFLCVEMITTVHVNNYLPVYSGLQPSKKSEDSSDFLEGRGQLYAGYNHY